MSFVIPSWYLAIFFFIVSIFFIVMSYFWQRSNKKSLIQAKELLFIVGMAYLILSHYAIYVSVGQALDESYQAPCENVVNSSSYVNNTFTTYTYVDSCAAITAPESSSSLVVIFTWLFFIGGGAVFIAVIVFMVRFAQRFV